MRVVDGFLPVKTKELEELPLVRMIKVVGLFLLVMVMKVVGDFPRERTMRMVGAVPFVRTMRVVGVFPLVRVEAVVLVRLVSVSLTTEYSPGKTCV